MKKIFAIEYGIFPEKSHNYVAHIANRIEQVGDDAEIVFASGTYLFDFNDTVSRQYAISNTYSVDRQAVSIVLEKHKNIILDFQDSTLLFTGWQMPFAVDDCCGITIKNASIDWETPTAALAQVLDVSPQALDVPDIDSQIGLMHTLFTLEDVYGLTVSEAGGEVCLKVNKDKGKEAYELLQMLYAWKEQADKLSAGEISKDDYDRWRYYYPKYDTTQLWAKVPSQELSDALAEAFKDKLKE